MNISRQSSLLYKINPGPISHAASLGRTTAIMGNRGDIHNTDDFETGRVQGAHCRFTAGTWPLHIYLQILDTEFLDYITHFFGGYLCSKGCALTGAAKAGTTGGTPGQSIALAVGNGDDGVVEGGVHVGDALGHVLLHLLARARRRSLRDALEILARQIGARAVVLPLQPG